MSNGVLDQGSSGTYQAGVPTGLGLSIGEEVIT